MANPLAAVEDVPGDSVAGHGDPDDQRDYAEEKYNREFCGACGASPCSWDGVPDGFHADAVEGA